jgi:PadR family transcriptional regulator PadR
VDIPMSDAPSEAAPESRRAPALPRTWLQSALLLLVLEGAGHGYQLADELIDLGLGDGDRGGTYRTLRGMEHQGLVTSRWEEGSGARPKRSYQITPLGLERLREISVGLREGFLYVSAFLQRLHAVDEQSETIAA